MTMRCASSTFIGGVDSRRSLCFLASMSDTAASQGGSKTQSVLVGVLFVLGAIYYFTAGREHHEQEVVNSMNDITAKVADDAVAQYQIAKRQGDPMQICVQAGMVSAAYLQAKNEGAYNQWKATEKADCGTAGLR
jgi:hypothetical protein